MRTRTLIVVSGGCEALPGIQRALALGLRVAVFDADPNAPGARAAQLFRRVSTYDSEGAAEAAREMLLGGECIDGVIAMAADVPHTVARVAAELGLPGPTMATARLSMDKIAQKERLRAAGVPVPWFQELLGARELEQALRARGGRVVVKPADSRGSRGVSLIADPAQCGAAFERARASSPSGRVLVEEFLAGPQVSSEALFVNGRAHALGFSDRNYARLAELAPYVIEDGGEQPSALDARARRELEAVAEAAGRAIGIADGPCKGDLVWTERGACVIEVAARLSGGWFSSDQIPLATGVDLVGAAIRQALGEPLSEAELRPARAQAVAIRYFFPRPGRVVALGDAEAVRRLPWVHRLELFARPGELVQEPTDHTRRAGCVITTGRDRAEAVERAQSIVREFPIETRSAA